MQGWIKNGIVNKPGPIPEFFRAVPELSPSGLQPMAAHRHTYVEGRCAVPSEVECIIESAKTFWKSIGTVCTREYKEYILAHRISHPVVQRALDLIPAFLPRCRIVHGDMTLENIIMPGPVFIDPGNPIICTPALDRGKLLQSIVMKWETRGWDNPGDIPTWADTIDLAFLVTHWVRLQKHQTNAWSGFDVLQSLLEKHLSSI